ncbi:DUF6894 family protein [Sphingomonas quercus]|nr:hypothetical protein [Sphingomonas quercus]
MPRYNIHTVERGTIQTPETVDLPDRDAVRGMAVQFASELLGACGGDIFEHDLEIRVVDDTGLMLFAITVAAIEAPAIPRR